MNKSKKVMKVTKEWLAKNYDKYNNLIFQGSLPKVGSDFDIMVSNARTTLGLFRCERNRTTMRKSYVIKVSGFYEMTEEEVADTLVHEMIHFFIYYMGVTDDSIHGRTFKRLMDGINKQYGLHVSVTRSMRNHAVSNPPTNLSHTIFVLVMEDGSRFISKVNDKYVDGIRRDIENLNSVDEVWWFRSGDEKFSLWRSHRTLRGYVLSDEEFDRTFEGLRKNAILLSHLKKRGASAAMAAMAGR